MALWVTSPILVMSNFELKTCLIFKNKWGASLVIRSMSSNKCNDDEIVAFYVCKH